MWKKFFITILSIALLGGAAFVSGSLFAAGDSTLQFQTDEQKDHYVNDEFSYTLSSSRSDESILYLNRGELHGNGNTYQIAFNEDAVVAITNIKKPGVYQGEVIAEATDGQNGGSKEIRGMLSFTVYGIIYQNTEYQIPIKEKSRPETYGFLPDQVKEPLYTYSVDDESIASVDEEGNVTGLKEGTTTLHMNVYNKVKEEDHFLYQSDAQIHVVKAQERQVQSDNALKGENSGYYFLQSENVYADIKEEQKIGVFELAQSGSFTYQVEDSYAKEYEVRDQALYLLHGGSEGRHEVKVYIKPKDYDYTYVVTCSYEIIKQTKAADDSFAFRYEGKDTSSIVRTYREGSNSFQITSNKNVDEVRYQLKNESDSPYMSVSETGNVTIKKISEKPIVITALWRNKFYELNVVIEKADQTLSTPISEITISLDDGSFDPIIEGRYGNGSLIADVQGASDIVDLQYSATGSLSIKPLKVGDVVVEIYNDEDQNYKKSNVLTIPVHVSAIQSVQDQWIAREDWIHLEGEKGKNGWFTSAVTLSCDKEAPIKKFQFQKQAYDSLKLTENGDNTLPITFVNQDGKASAVVKLSVPIDTHAPHIVSIDEREAADHDWKKFIDRLTFQMTFGSGMIIDIETSDDLLNEATAVSGVKEISYRIYRLNDGKETLLQEGREAGDHLEIYVEDTGTHKVCASVEDEAGLQSGEVCNILDETHQETAVPSDNTGMILYSRAFSKGDCFQVHEVDEEALTAVKSELKLADSAFVTGYEIEWENQNPDVSSGEIRAVIPVSSHQAGVGTWYQKQGDGTYKEVNAGKVDHTQVLHLNSLNNIYYVQTGADVTGSSGFHLAKPEISLSLTQPEKNEVSKLLLRPLLYDEYDLKLLAIAVAGLISVCFIILLIRSGREEY